MAWEKRKGCGSSYYYMSVRVGGKVKKIYLGKGAEADAASVAVAEARGQREGTDFVFAFEQLEFGQVMSQTMDLNKLANCVMEAALLCAGFRKVTYGQWRKPHARTSSE